MRVIVYMTDLKDRLDVLYLPDSKVFGNPVGGLRVKCPGETS